MGPDQKHAQSGVGLVVQENRISQLLVGIVLAAILVGGALVILTSRLRHQDTFNLKADTAGYFAWGYSVLNEGRVDPGPVLKRWDSEDFMIQREVDGRTTTVDIYPIGWSLATLPFMAAGKGVALFFGYPAEDERTLTAMVFGTGTTGSHGDIEGGLRHMGVTRGAFFLFFRLRA